MHTQLVKSRTWMSRRSILIIAAVVVVYGAASSPQLFAPFYGSRPSGSAMRIFDLINQDRNLYNLAPFRWDANLANEATEHSYAISKNEVPNWALFPRYNVFTVKSGEWGRSFYLSPRFVLDKWLNSNQKYRNGVLNPDYNAIGIGTSENGGTMFIVILVGE